MESVVLITTVQPALLAWVGAISFFVSLAMTAMVSPNRKWFELVVIFALCFLVNAAVVAVVVQWVVGVEMVQVEAIGRMSYGGVR